MFCQGVLVTVVVLAAVYLSPSSAQKNGQNALAGTGKLCPASSESEKLCKQCALTASGITEQACCQDEQTYARCRQYSSVRSRRDVGYSSLVGPEVTSRARPFLGKRARYLLAKRLRNNFLGKRSELSGYEGSVPLVDSLEHDDEDKRARPFLGKKARPFLGKRSQQYDDLEDLIDQYTDGQAEEDKRARPFLGKRARRPFLGKRARRPFLGKRDYEGEGDRLEGLALGDSDEKRARPFLGKRGRRPFLGKRQDEDDFLDDDDLMKRAARYMLGKRQDGGDSEAAGEDAEKRRRYMLGKRSAEDGDNVEENFRQRATD